MESQPSKLTFAAPRASPNPTNVISWKIRLGASLLKGPQLQRQANQDRNQQQQQSAMIKQRTKHFIHDFVYIYPCIIVSIFPIVYVIQLSVYLHPYTAVTTTAQIL